MSSLTLKKHTGVVNCTIDLASSKSESNRALIINALSGNQCQLDRLANARDTETMQRLLELDRNTPASEKTTLDVLDAGTTMRFLTAYTASQGHHRVMTGTQRMTERPIGLLVDALRELGADIDYLKNDGYPPHEIKGFQQKTNKLSIRGDISSQYISALLMVAPSLPNGLEITLTEKVASWPYLDMTIKMMEYFGISVLHSAQGTLRPLKPGETIQVAPQGYAGKQLTIEADWSGASYWYSIVALSEGAVIKINGLKAGKDSLQGDAVMAYNHFNDSHEGIMKAMGVATSYDSETGVTTLNNIVHDVYFEHDFTYCPDIAQTVAVICAAKGIKARLTGLESLRIKETDRIDAIKNELAKFGVEVKVEGDEAIEIEPQSMDFSKKILINTYKDHRMAMAFAPLALRGDVEIENPDVVNKSYPDFWRDLEIAGFQYS